jgi:hypothetical protein
MYESIESFITLFQFNISRKNDDECIRKLGNDLKAFIEELKLKIKHASSSTETYRLHLYIRMMFKLIFYTRDISHGKGERKLTYMMLCAWFKYYPILTIAAIKIMFGENDEFSIGCWRDVKHLCTHAKSENMEGFIDTILTIAHNQTVIDYASLSSDSCIKISNIAKWLPRENSDKFSWIFSRLAVLWCQEACPCIMNTPKTQFQKQRALNLCYGNYRKVISSLNRFLETPEIKLCANKLEEQSHITLSTHSKLNYINTKRSQHFMNIRSFKKKFTYTNNNHSIKIKCNNKLSICDYIKKSLEFSDKNNHISSNYINYQWSNFVEDHNFCLNEVIPMIDVSHSMRQFNNTSLYAALGLASLIASKSNLQSKMIIVDNIPSFAECCDTITDTAIEILRNNPQNTESNFISAFKLVAEAASNTNMSPEKVGGLTFVILSDMFFLNKPEYEDFHQILIQIFGDAGVRSQGGMSYPVPKIVLWNLSQKNIPSDIMPIDIQLYPLLSGFSTHTIKYIENDTHLPDDAFSTLRRILSSMRYKKIDTCIRCFMNQSLI